jgi:hypothetical protein
MWTVRKAPGSARIIADVTAMKDLRPKQRKPWKRCSLMVTYQQRRGRQG